MVKKKEITRQGLAYRAKHWTKTLYDKNGNAYLVSPNHYMEKPDKKKK